MADQLVDTSSYRMPDPPNPADIAAKYTGIATNQFDLAKKHYDTLSNEIASMAADPSLTHDKLMNHMQYLTKMGLITPQQMAQTAAQMPTDAGQLKGFVQQQLMRVQDSKTQFETKYGRTQDIGNDAGTVVGSRSITNPGQFTPGTYVPKQASGATSSNIKQPEIGPDGKPTGRLVETALPDDIKQEIASGRARMTPDGRVVPIAPRQPLVSPVSSQGQPDPQNMLMRGQPSTPVRPSVTGNRLPIQPALQTPAPRVGLVVGAPQGADVVQTGLSSAAVSAAENLRQEAANSPQNKALLDNIEAQLNDANSGPLAKFIASKGAAINQVTKAIANREPIPTDVIKAHENFVKNATLLQQQQAKALGGTVSALANSEHSVPSLNFSTAGNREIIATLRGTQDAVTAKNNAWQKYLDGGGSPQDFRKFENDFNKTFEPRAYQFPYLTKAEQKKVIESLPSPSSRKEFFKRAADAVRQGYIKPGAVGE